MKKLITNKYFLIIWAIVLAIFNACLFILTKAFKEEVLSKSVFWVTYGFVTASFVMILIIRLLYNHNDKNIDLFPIFVLPTLLFIILIGIILFIFANKINSFVWILVIFIILFGFASIGLVLSIFTQASLKSVPVKEIEVIDYNGLSTYLSNLSMESTNDVIKAKTSSLLALTQNVIYKDDEECKKLDDRIFEIAIFLKKDIKENSVNNFVMNASNMEKLLKQRIGLN